MRPGMKPTPAIDRLLRRVVKTETCWLYPGATNGRGYGVIGESIPVRRQVYVHRVMWESLHGPIPKGMEVCHTCDVRNCVRPDHLFLGTHAENVRDQVEKGRNRKGVQMYWIVKLDEKQVRTIRTRLAAGESRRELAVEYGVSQSQIDNIANRKQWKHVA